MINPLQEEWPVRVIDWSRILLALLWLWSDRLVVEKMIQTIYTMMELANCSNGMS